MLEKFLEKAKLFLDKNRKNELYQDVAVEFLDENTIVISIGIANYFHNKLATITVLNNRFLLDMTPVAIANSYFTKIVRTIIENGI